MFDLVRLIEPEVDNYLYADFDEFVIAEIPHHWITRLPGIIGLCLIIPVSLWSIWSGPWLPWIALVLLVALVLSAVAVQLQYMRRVVFTTMRVLTVAGWLRRRSVMLPLGEIARIEMTQPLLGRIIGFGHIKVISDDGDVLDLRFIPHPRDHEDVLQQVIGLAEPWPGDDAVS